MGRHGWIGLPRGWDSEAMGDGKHAELRGMGIWNLRALGAVYSTVPCQLVNACMYVVWMDGCMLCVRACLCAAGGFYADEGKRVKSEE